MSKVKNTKVCSKCKENLSTSEFYKHSPYVNNLGRVIIHTDNLSSQCRFCQLKNKKRYYFWNRDEIKEKGKIRYRLNSAKFKENRKEYYKKNSTIILAKDKIYRDKNPLMQVNAKLKKSYGITIYEKSKILIKQSYKCAICSKELSLLKKDGQRQCESFIDHDHKTKKIRGILCHHCNAGIGHFFDRKDLLQNAILYLDS